MINETKITTDVFGDTHEYETKRLLTNRELEERLYELTDIVKNCVMYNPHILGTDLLENLVERLDKLQEDFS